MNMKFGEGLVQFRSDFKPIFSAIRSSLFFSKDFTMCEIYSENPEIKITSEYEKTEKSHHNNSINTTSKINRLELQEAINSGINYLNKVCDPKIGFQNSSIGKTRTELKPTKHYVEVFTSTLALDLLGNELSQDNRDALYAFVMPEYKYGSINFNKGQELVPDDVDCTALALAVFLRDGAITNGKQLLDLIRLIILNTNPDGIIETYFPPRGIRNNRIDPATTSNVMRFLYLTGYESEAIKSEDYLYNCLSSGEFLNKCYYYVCPEAFFYFLSTAIILNPKARLRFESLLVENIVKRLGLTNHPLDVSMRILALGNLGLLKSEELKDKIEVEIQELLSMKDEKTGDGAFKEDCLFRFGRSEIFFGGHHTSTIFVVAALKEYLDKGY